MGKSWIPEDGSPVMVQFLPGPDDGHRMPVAMGSQETSQEASLSLEMADHLYLGLPFYSRFLLFLCLVHPRCAHLGHQPRASFWCCGRIRGRLAHLQGEKHKEQVARPALRDHSHDSSLDRFYAVIN